MPSNIWNRVKNIFSVDYDEYDDNYNEDENYNSPDSYNDAYYDDYEEDYEEEEKKRNQSEKKRYGRKDETESKREDDLEDEDRSQKKHSSVRFFQPRGLRSQKSGKVVPIKRGDGGMEVCVVKPTQYDTVKEVMDTLIDGKSVVLNLEGMNIDLSQRIVDFTSGGVYSINGKLKKISSYIYLLTPENVDITGDFLDVDDNGNPTGSFTPNYSSYVQNNYQN